MSELHERWEAIESLLREAAAALPTPKASNASGASAGAAPLKEFEDYLRHNELELAWDELAACAEATPDTTLVWFHLAEAAALMELAEHKERAIRRMVETWPRKDSPYRLGYVLAKPLPHPVSA